MMAGALGGRKDVFIEVAKQGWDYFNGKRN